MKGYEPTNLPHPQVEASAIPEEWPPMIREIVQREGRAIRGGAERNTIEIKSLTDNTWGELMLPGNGVEFTTAEERDIILAKINGR